MASTTDTIGPSLDAELQEVNPDTNRGTNGRMVLGKDSQGRRNNVIVFDISSVPKGASIGEALLRINVVPQGEAVSAEPFTARRLLRSVGEASVTWNTPWETSGGTGSSDVTSTNSVGGTLTTDINGGFYDLRVTSAVADAHALGDTSVGWVLSLDGSVNSIQDQFTKEEIEETFRPQLVITWVVQDPVNRPSPYVFTHHDPLTMNPST